MEFRTIANNVRDLLDMLSAKRSHLGTRGTEMSKPFQEGQQIKEKMWANAENVMQNKRDYSCNFPIGVALNSNCFWVCKLLTELNCKDTFMRRKGDFWNILNMLQWLYYLYRKSRKVYFLHAMQAQLCYMHLHFLILYSQLAFLYLHLSPNQWKHIMKYKPQRLNMEAKQSI